MCYAFRVEVMPRVTREISHWRVFLEFFHTNCAKRVGCKLVRVVGHLRQRLNVPNFEINFSYFVSYPLVDFIGEERYAAEDTTNRGAIEDQKQRHVD